MSPERKPKRTGREKMIWREFFDMDKVDQALTINYTRIMKNYALQTQGTEDVSLPLIAERISQSTVQELLHISETTMLKGSSPRDLGINMHFLQLCVIAYGQIYTKYRNENNFLRILANAKSSNDEYKKLVIGEAFAQDIPTR